MKRTSIGHSRWSQVGALVCSALAILWSSARSENRLVNETSPYLQLHKDNPVEWYPWGVEAFERAKRENKPVFVSIGYSACHWCHVMARESFEDRQIAELLNEHFINVKVDREERPDVDRLCMAFVQATTGSGGWPLNVWMTPAGEPFLGGTYFPPEDRGGRPGFRTVIRQVAEAWNSDEEGIRAHGAKVIEALRSSSASKPPKSATGIVRSAYEELVRAYDQQWGGFGTSEKFPGASALKFLMRLHASAPASPEGKAALAMVRNTLSKMAAGGLHDHLGGGFHRYAVDRAWQIPHFEKMLSDQAQLAAAYCAAWQLTGDPLFEQTARDILEYVLRDLAHPKGGFFTAVDAESPVAHGDLRRAEGAYYLWSAAEIDKALDPEEKRIFHLRYNIKPEGNVPEAIDARGELRGKNVLFAQRSIPELARQLGISEELADQLLSRTNMKLLALRERRPSPRRDEKVLTAWNGLMISAYARVGAALDEERYLAAAANAARFLRSHLFDTRTGTLHRSWNRETAPIPGFAEDYAFLIQGLLDLYESSADPEMLKWAIALQAKQDELFWDAKAGGYFCGTADGIIEVRLKHDHDGSEPSANSVSALNLLRLSRLLHDDRYAQRARDVFTAFSAALNGAPVSVPYLVAAWQYSQTEPRQAVIAGDPRSEAGRQLARAVLRNFHPELVVLYSRDFKILSGEAASAVEAMQPIEGRPAIYLCENFTCREPTTSPEKVRALLARAPEDHSE